MVNSLDILQAAFLYGLKIHKRKTLSKETVNTAGLIRRPRHTSHKDDKDVCLCLAEGLTLSASFPPEDLLLCSAQQRQEHRQPHCAGT